MTSTPEGDGGISAAASSQTMAATKRSFQQGDARTQREQQRLTQLLASSVLSTNVVMLAMFVAFATIFLGTLVIGAIVTFLVGRFVKFVKLQWFDRALGAGFGVIRGWVFVAVVLLGLTAFGVQTERLMNSALAPYFLPGSRIIAVATPYDMKARFLVGYRAVEKWWREH